MAPGIYAPFSVRPGVRVRVWEGKWLTGVLLRERDGLAAVRLDGGKVRAFLRTEVEGEIGPD